MSALTQVSRDGLSLLCALLLTTTGLAQEKNLFFAEGVKVGEVTDREAVVWTRLCAAERCDTEFLLPGVAGEVRVRYRTDGLPQLVTPWAPVDPAHDFTIQIRLADLSPKSVYTYTVEARDTSAMASFTGRFRTAPSADEPEAVRLVVTTCHKYATAEQRDLGPKIYPSMLAVNPDFFVHSGDVVYYDQDTPPLATTVDLARLHWHRMYSLPRRVEFHRQIVSYFMKDDHDLLANDCWPGQTFGELTFDDGVGLFAEQVPSRDSPYRSIRWGAHVQVWLVEGREFRSPNDLPDGSSKTIWGERQMRWLREGMKGSDATFKLLVSPTPIVGPDRDNKFDNHANDSFATEGREVRQFLADLPNTFVLCGDRHWQYVSVDPATGLREYSCGSSSDAHAGGWDQNDRRSEHRFLRVAGGFLSVEVTTSERPAIVFRLHDVEGKVVHSETHIAAG